MLSVIFITDEKKDGKYELTEERLKELLQQAYNQGYEDGKGKYQLQPYITNIPGAIPCGDKTTDPFWYERQTKPWWSEITCETAPKTGFTGSDSVISSNGFDGKVHTTLLNTSGQKCMHEGDLFPAGETCTCQGVCHCGGDKV